MIKSSKGLKNKIDWHVDTKVRDIVASQFNEAVRVKVRNNITEQIWLIILDQVRNPIEEEISNGKFR